MLQIIRLKPNPAGKDRVRSSTPSASQLAGEWVDFKNTGSQAVDLAGLELFHLAYQAGGGKPDWQKVRSFSTWVLQPSQVVRVHSGAGQDTSIIRPEDSQGTDFHAFTGSNQYIWNNAEGDCAWLGWTRTNQGDKACYDPNPPEGQVLLRVGEKLVPTGVRV